MAFYLLLLIQAFSLACKRNSKDLESLTKSSSYFVSISSPKVDFYTSRYGFDEGFGQRAQSSKDSANEASKLDSINPMIEIEIEIKIKNKDAHCQVAQGKYALDSRPLVFTEFYMVRFLEAPSGCRLREGYFRKNDVQLSSSKEGEFGSDLGGQVGGDAGIIQIGSKTACEFSWEEKLGTTDYTIWDSYLERNYPAPDRAQGETLQGLANSKTPPILTAGRSIDVLCHNGKILKGCFARGLERAARDPIGSVFIEWSKKYSIDPLRLRMALAMQETNLGGLRDHCRGACNGIGMNQIITIVTDSGQETANPARPEWPGITHNILTNMKYGARVLAKKIQYSQPSSIRSLASAYNGSSNRVQYGIDVERFYQQLKTSCNL